MWTRILVPLDGSQRAERALPIAVRLARARHGTLVLFRVYDMTPSVLAPDLVMDAYVGDLAASAAYLEAVAARPELAGVLVEVHALAGAVALTIVDATRAYEADSIVMCSHGRSGFARWALGSVAEKVARHADVPVLVLRDRDGPSANVARSAASGPVRVIVGLDGSALAAGVIGPAAELAAALSAEERGVLHLVQALTPGNARAATGSTDAAAHEHAASDAQRYLRREGEHASASLPALHVEWSVEHGPDVATALIQLVERLAQSAPDETMVIALAAHGHGALHWWTMERTGRRVLERTHTPTLLVRPHLAAPEQWQSAEQSADMV